MLHLTVEIRHDPIYQAGPYQVFMTWCAQQNIPHDSGWYLEVFDEDPVRAVMQEIDVDEHGEWVMDPETGEPVTHPVHYTCSALPPLQGSIIR